MADGAASAAETWREVDVHPGSDGKGGGGFTEDGGLNLAATEHGHTVIFYMITVRPVWGVGKGTWGAIGDAVAGAGGN